MDYFVFPRIEIDGLNEEGKSFLDFDSFRDVGNYSAHSITYTAGKLDIDKISREYRVMMEDLYNRAGII